MVKISLNNKKIEIKNSDSLTTITQNEMINDALGAKIGNLICDLDTKISKPCEIEILTFKDIEGKKIYWHTSAHILAQAVKRLYPNVKLGTGPAIENGFYYDFDFADQSFTKENLLEVENEINKIIKENHIIYQKSLDRESAIALMKERNEDYKCDLINEKNDLDNFTFYFQGEYADLCKGPHLLSTGKIGAVALTSLTGAYWKGDVKNKMLVRIYGVSFPTELELNDYLKKIEEAKKRDHNKLGRSLKFFTTVDYIGQGLPVLLPKGAKVIQLLQRIVEDEEEKRGYLLTKTPFVSKNDIYEISGHWTHYKEGMFILNNEEGENSVYALRPMTCPFQFQVYLNDERSYKDLPMRLNETSTLFRKEQSGEMHGLIRIRQFTISEGHIACTPEQLGSEFKSCLELANYFLEMLGFKDDVFYRFSKWDKNDKEKYIGTEKEWNEVQDIMKNILDNLELEYVEADGEAAFYGPKLDVQFRNVYGKEDTLITIQIDFQLSKRFEMKYTDYDGVKKYPYVIHRTSLGCYERTLAMLIEKYAGAMPIWIAPEQVRILPVNENLIKYSKEIAKTLNKNGIIRVNVDNSNEKIGYKIRKAQEEKIPYMLIIGNKEVENKNVAVRHRKKGDIGSISLNEFIKMVKEEIDNKFLPEQ